MDGYKSPPPLLNALLNANQPNLRLPKLEEVDILSYAKTITRQMDGKIFSGVNIEWSELLQRSIYGY